MAFIDKFLCINKPCPFLSLDPVDLSKPKKAKSVKKKNKKPVEAADLFDSPSIFDDPLNALGN